MADTRQVRGCSQLALVALSMSIGTAGSAQDVTAAADGAGAAEDIVVTAQKREERLQDVPISIRALGSKEIGRLGEGNLQGFSGFVPSLNLIEQGPSRTQITMRGVSTGDLRFDRPELRETVGLYLDETPISTQIVSPNLGLLDIERIEVLRGPQGTLYGAGSLSGTIRMITRKPELDSVSGSASATGSVTRFGGFNYETTGVLNVPLVADLAAIRAAGFYRYQDGFIDNITTGEDNINDTRDYGGRLSLRVVPTPEFTIDGTLVYQRTTQGGDFSFRAEEGDLEETTTIEEPSASRLFIGVLTLGYDAGWATLTSVTSYFRKRSEFALNAGGFSEFITGVEDDIDGPTTTFFRQNEFTQELRLSSALGRLTYTIGGFYQHQDNGFSQSADLPGIDAAGGFDSTDFGARPDQVFGSDITLKTRQIALFGEATFKVIESLELTLGGRYFDVRQDSSTFFFGVLSASPGERNDFRFSEDGFNPKVNLTYRVTPDHLVYVQASKGFRLGGTNQPIPASICGQELADLGFSSPPDSFKSDSLWNYEAGAKTSWADGRFTANAAVYRIDWTNPPLAVDLRCGFSTLINAGKFRINGAEMDLEARPVPGLVLRGGGAYNNGRLVGDLPVLGGLDGDRVPQTPRWTLNASGDYDFALGADSRGFVHANWRYVGDRYTLFPNSPNYSGVFRLPAYHLVGIRAGALFGRWSVEAFVDNLFDERAVLNQTAFARAFDENPGTAIYTNRPRTGGVKASIAF